MPAHLYIVYGCFCTTMVESISCKGDCIAYKAKNIYYLALYPKICQFLLASIGRHFLSGKLEVTLPVHGAV